MSSKKYTEEEFVNAWATSLSIAGVARKLGIVPRGGNYKTLNRLAKKNGLTKEHMSGQGWLKGQRHSYSKRALNEILIEGRPYQSDGLRRRLLSDGVFEHQCYKCNLSEWQDQPIPLELEHINGVHDDNRLENLTILCPNCHAQTPTYRGRNINQAGVKGTGLPRPLKKDGRAEMPIVGSNPITRTCKCGEKMRQTSSQCKSCYHKNRVTKIGWPSREELLDRLQTSNYTKLGGELGVSDNAIRKYLKGETRHSTGSSPVSPTL